MLALMAKQSQQTSSSEAISAGDAADSGNSELQVLLKEISRLVVKQHKDSAVQKAYTDCFMLLTKNYYESGDAESRKQLVAVFEDLVAKFLTGRVLAGSGLSIRFFQQAFEQCPEVAWSVHKAIIKCFLVKESSKKADG